MWAFSFAPLWPWFVARFFLRHLLNNRFLPLSAVRATIGRVISTPSLTAVTDTGMGQVCSAETFSSSNLSMVIIRKLSMFIQTMLHPFNMNLIIMIYIYLNWSQKIFFEGLNSLLCALSRRIQNALCQICSPTSSPRHPNWLDGVNYSGQIGIEVATYQIGYCVCKYDEKNFSLLYFVSNSWFVELIRSQ